MAKYKLYKNSKYFLLIKGNKCALIKRVKKMINYTPPASDIIELKNEMKKLKEQLESETLAKNEGTEIIAELEVEIKEKETKRIELMTRLNDVNNENHALEIESTKLKTDCKTLAQILLKVSPEHKDWLEKNFKEYL